MSDNKGREGGLLKKLTRGEADEVQDSQQQQLMLLFEKRNELKREFGRTLDELAALKSSHEKLLQEHQRYADRLRGLEDLLHDPARAQNAIIYYRLDSVWRQCRALLAQRRHELAGKFEEIEKHKALENFRANAVEQQKQLERKFEQYDSIYQEMAQNLVGLQDQLRRSDRWWHHFRRKRLEQEVAESEAQVAPVVAQRDECLAELERVRDREPPAFKGLSVAAMREINLQLIAFAQYLYINFSENDLAALARATQEKGPGESHYGTAQECLAMERPIRDAAAKLKKDDQRYERLKRRADFLRQHVQFTGNTDAIPEPHTLNRIALSVGGSSSDISAPSGELVVNVLEQGYWNVNELLLGQVEAQKKKARTAVQRLLEE